MDFNWFKELFGNFTLFKSTKKNSPKVSFRNKKGAIETQIGQQNNYYGLSYTEATNLVESLVKASVEERLIQFRAEAEDTYHKRAKEFESKLILYIKNLNEEEYAKLKE